MSKKTKFEKGITLIALIITIIVLLILAGVTIAILTGENGILNRAVSAREKMQRGEIIEDLQLKIYEKQSYNNGEITESELIEILEEAGVLSNEENVLDKTLTTDKGNYDIKVSEIWNGELEEKEKTIKAADIAKDPKIYFGKEVIAYNCESNGVKSWKVFYSDDTNVYLIANNYINYTKAPLGKNKKTIVTKASDNSFSDVTDERVKQLNKAYFEYLDTNQLTNDSNQAKNIAYLLDTTAWNIYSGEKAEYAIGGPTVELCVKSANAKYGTNIIYRIDENKSGAYQFSLDNGSTWKYETPLGSGDDELYYLENKNYCMPFVASLGYTDDPDEYGYSLFTLYKSLGAWTYESIEGLRPVVCLSSDVEFIEEGDTLRIKGRNNFRR